jgi:CO/xanthine dehydrogenase Mo-binding subunit
MDLADKILGNPRFIQDMRLPNQLFGRIIRPPHRGVTAVELDATAVLSRDDVHHVVINGAFVGVVANSEIAAIEAAAELSELCTWVGTQELPTTSSVTDFLLSAPHLDEVLADGPETSGFSARYSRPFIAHASIGTSTAIAQFADDALTIYSHTQGVYPLRADIARALGMDPAKIRIEHVEGAGCYGHNPADDVAYDAALLALAVPGHPIHVTWSREDELGWGPLGPAMVVDISCSTDSAGNITTWQWDGYGNGHSSRPSTLPSPSLLAYQFQASGAPIPPSEDPAAATGAGTGRNAVPGYAIPNVRAMAHRLTEMPIRASALRSLGAHLNVFATESHMDDLARQHERDPIEYRLAHLTDARGRAVLEKAAEMAHWGTPLGEDRGRGIGYARYKNAGAWCAVVAEIRATDSINVTKLYICTDVGRVINPDGVRNQIEGGALQAMSWTLIEQVRMAGAAIVSNTWEEYPILGFPEVPPVEVAIIERPDEAWLGSGEASMGPTAAAIGNAITDALGVRVRDLPITPEAIVAAMAD